MIPASQAHRRAWSPVIVSPVSSEAAFRPPIRVERSMVTTMVAFTPPAAGSLLVG